MPGNSEWTTAIRAAHERLVIKALFGAAPTKRDMRRRFSLLDVRSIFQRVLKVIANLAAYTMRSQRPCIKYLKNGTTQLMLRANQATIESQWCTDVTVKCCGSSHCSVCYIATYFEISFENGQVGSNIIVEKSPDVSHTHGEHKNLSGKSSFC